MKKLIINVPNLAPFYSRVGWLFVTATFWAIWVYLWMPLLTILMWALGINVYSEYFIGLTHDEFVDLMKLLGIYAIVILILGGSLLLWASTEYMRFRNVNRRTKPIPVNPTELAAYAEIAPTDLSELQKARQIIAHHDDQGKFLYAEIMVQEE